MRNDSEGQPIAVLLLKATAATDAGDSKTALHMALSVERLTATNRRRTEPKRQPSDRLPTSRWVDDVQYEQGTPSDE
jgi:hypothetical protein